MLDTLEIVNFRCFERFEMKGLARVNLLVGANNSGKTSVLEAVELWASQGDPETLWSVVQRRGEFQLDDDDHLPVLRLRHLFRGHRMDVGQTFQIAGSTRTLKTSLTVAVDHYSSSDKQKDLFDEDLRPRGRLALVVGFTAGDDRETAADPQSTASRAPATYLVPLAVDGQANLRDLSVYRHPGEPLRQRDVPPRQFITTRSLSAAEVEDLLGDVVLTPEEPLIVSALQIVEPTIERVALTRISRKRRRDLYSEIRSTVVVKSTAQNERIPIAVMGDGTWRILGLALSLVDVQGGILLVDEIDTGLHYTVMEDMWKLVCQTAERLNVQVFATTHSRDCYESLAAVIQDEQTGGASVALHRIEREQGRSVVFSEDELVNAAERGLETR